MGWFALVGSELYFCSGDEDEEEGVLQLKRLQELSENKYAHIPVEWKIHPQKFIYVFPNPYDFCRTQQASFWRIIMAILSK